MIKSMTAFASATEITDEIEVSWEIRSVNHRYLDVSVYIPEGFQQEEKNFADIMRNKIGRGKVDAKLVCNLLNQAFTKIDIDKARVKELVAATKSIESITGQQAAINPMEILQWPGVIQENKTDYSEYHKTATELLHRAIDDFIKSRETEGDRLEALIRVRADKIIKIVSETRKRRSAVVAAMRRKVIDKIEELDVSIDNNRLEQELVYQTQRLDVDEELDRLDAHADEVSKTLDLNEPIGRRLDFLMQELNREANTLASKSNDNQTTNAAVALKVLIEQMREQVMNIE